MSVLIPQPQRGAGGKTAPPYDIGWIIDRLEEIPDDLWQEDRVRSAARVGDAGSPERNCLFGHLFNLGGGDALVEVGGRFRPHPGGDVLWGWFEENWATTYMVYPVNDGGSEQYQQPTIKGRCLAYLRDLRDGRTPTTLDYWEMHGREDEVRALGGDL